MLSFLYRLCERDPYQLYQRLEQQAREYVLEMKVRLLRQLSAASKVRTPAALQGPPQAHQFISLLLEEYGALCQAARTISTFLGTLVRQRAAFLGLCGAPHGGCRWDLAQTRLSSGCWGSGGTQFLLVFPSDLAGGKRHWVGWHLGGIMEMLSGSHVRGGPGHVSGKAGEGCVSSC